MNYWKYMYTWVSDFIDYSPALSGLAIVALLYVIPRLVVVIYSVILFTDVTRYVIVSFLAGGLSIWFYMCKY